MENANFFIGLCLKEKKDALTFKVAPSTLATPRASFTLACLNSRTKTIPYPFVSLSFFFLSAIICF